MSDNIEGEARDSDSGLLIFILLIALLLGGIGVGGYFVLGHRRQAAEQAEIQAMEAARAAQEAAAAAEAQRKGVVP